MIEAPVDVSYGGMQQCPPLTVNVADCELSFLSLNVIGGSRSVGRVRNTVPAE